MPEAGYGQRKTEHILFLSEEMGSSESGQGEPDPRRGEGRCGAAISGSMLQARALPPPNGKPDTGQSGSAPGKVPRKE
jgi:hypothetical protein